MANNRIKNRQFPVPPPGYWDQRQRSSQASANQGGMRRPLPVNPNPIQSIGNQAFGGPQGGGGNTAFAGLTPEETQALHNWLELTYEEKLDHLNQVAQHQGYDRGWPQRNLQNVTNLINRLPARKHVSVDTINRAASYMADPELT